MLLTFTPDERSAGDLAEFELESAFEHEVGTKEGPAFIPARFGVQRRATANVVAMTGFCVDLDHLTPAQAEQACHRVNSLGVECFAWTTYSHTPEEPHFRLLFPFAEELPLPVPARWGGQFWPKFVEWLGLAAKPDPQARDAARLYFLPRHKEGAEFDAVHMRGPLLDWRTVLGSDAGAAPGETRIMFGSTESSPARSERGAAPTHVDLDVIRSRLRGMKDSSGAVKNFLAARDVTHPHTKGHHGAWLEVTTALAHAVDDAFPSEALRPLILKSYAAQLVDSPDSKATVEVIEGMLESARVKVADLRARKAAATEAFRAGVARAKPREGSPKPSVVSVEGSPEPAGEPFIVPEDWELALEMDMADPEKPKAKALFENIVIILKCDERYCGKLRYDRFLDVRLFGDRELKDTDIFWIAADLEKRWPYRIKANLQRTCAAVEAVCDEQSFDSLEDKFRAFRGQWDGVARLDTFLARYFGCADTPHHRAIGKKTLIAGVARALRPGCDVQTMLVLEGAQGTRKSSALRVLGGEFFTDAFFDVASKDGWAKCSASHVVELGELNAMTKRDVNAFKQFLTQSEDKFRPPYGRQSVTRKRRCLLCGTTNDAEYLVDDTGNRRFWIAHCGDVDLEALKRDVGQIWAEAVHLFDLGEQWWLTAEEAQAAEEVASDRLPTNLLAEHMERSIREALPSRKSKFMKGVDIVRLMDLDPSRVNSREVARAARAIGLGKSTVRGGTRGYLIPAAMLEAKEGAVAAGIARAAAVKEASA